MEKTTVIRNRINATGHYFFYIATCLSISISVFFVQCDFINSRYYMIKYISYVFALELPQTFYEKFKWDGVTRPLNLYEYIMVLIIFSFSLLPFFLRKPVSVVRATKEGHV